MVFYAFNISINIISLSGLALGLGMLIDNAIIVLDNISAKRQEGQGLVASCVLGVKEVSTPLISSVLTTLAVFVPLVFLHGMAGALFYDQAIAVAAILGVSLLVSFTILPLLYKIFFVNKEVSAQGNRLFNFILTTYDKWFAVAWRHKAISLVVISILCLGGIWLGLAAPRQVLPDIERHDFLMQIDWNEPIGLERNEQRVRAIIAAFAAGTKFAEAEVGVVGHDPGAASAGRDKAEIYFMLTDSVAPDSFAGTVRQWLGLRFPQAILTFSPAPNAFDRLFANSEPLLIAKLRARDSLLTANGIAGLLGREKAKATFGKGFATETNVLLTIDNEKLALYDIDRQALQEQLSQVFAATEITTLKRFGSKTVVSLMPFTGAHYQLDKLYITSGKGITYPLNNFVSVTYGEGHKYLTADDKGGYQAVLLTAMPQSLTGLREKLVNRGILVDFAGSYFTARENLKQLLLVLFISFALLYFILAAQFESFWQPLIIIFTLPLGVGGSLLLIYLTGSSLNIMSAIGIIVMLGIMINDAILKLDTINRFVKKNEGNIGKDALFRAIHNAGMLRLRPILMTSMTTILALLPVLFTGGLGADLQRGLVVAVIGGLTVGTFTAVFFIPIAYYYLISLTGRR